MTLVELLCATVVGSTIFGISVELLTLAMWETSTGRDQAVSTATLARLGEQFRADVHAAETVSQAKKGEGQVLWTMKLPDDQRIEYEPRDNTLRRTEYRGDQVHARDAFALPAADWRLELKPAENPVEASLLIKREGNAKDDAAGFDLRIDAHIGRDLRFEKR